MCFFANSDKSRAKLTEVDLVGFKFLKHSKKGIRSPFRKSTFWKAGDIKKESAFQKTAADGEVSVGFHCYRTFDEAYSNRETGSKVYMVTIPANSLVHVNDTQYCSDQMRLEPLELTKRR